MSRNGTSTEGKMLEGHEIEFLGDDTMHPRKGIITDIVHKSSSNSTARVIEAVVLWDKDEFIAVEDDQEIICWSACTVYPISVVLDKSRFKIIPKRLIR